MSGKVYLNYDLETIESKGFKAWNSKVVQFYGQIYDQDFNLIDELEVKQKCKLSDFLLKSGHDQNDYDNGLDYTDFVTKIGTFIDKHKPTTLVGHNIINFDNPRLRIMMSDYGTVVPKSTHDTRTKECYINNINMYTKNASTLVKSCRNNGIEFDPSVAHDAKYDAMKTWELFLSQQSRLRHNRRP